MELSVQGPHGGLTILHGGGNSLLAVTGDIRVEQTSSTIPGDTSQDGNWYAGQPFSVLGYEFGEKPFDPFPKLPDGENEDDE